jgi:hypothetical protein
MFDLLVNLLIFMAPAAALSVVCRRFSRTSRDEWRLLAWVPVIPLAVWGILLTRDVTRDRTSHNLWPFELAFWLTISVALLGLFLAGRRLLQSDKRIGAP